MKRPATTIASAIIGVLLSLALVSCGEKGEAPSGTDDAVPGSRFAAQDKPLVVGFSQVGAESTWRTAETASIKAEAKDRGIELKFSDAQGKPERQLQALRNFITQKVDAIILAPKVKTGWEPVLKEAKQTGIPVVLVDRGIEVSDESLYVTLIASDFVAEGRMAAEWLAKQTNGRAKIVELQGSPGADPAIDRKRGFAEGIAAYPAMRIIDSNSGEFNMQKGKEVMEAFLKKHGRDIQAVYAHNDDMALGAIQAIEEAGIKPGEEIVIISIDGVRGAFEAILDGKLNCTVECNPLLGPLAFDAVQKTLAGETLPKRTTIQDRVFDQSNAEHFVASRQY